MKRAIAATLLLTFAGCAGGLNEAKVRNAFERTHSAALGLQLAVACDRDDNPPELDEVCKYLGRGEEGLKHAKDLYEVYLESKGVDDEPENSP